MEIVNNGRDTTKNSFHNLHGGKQDPPTDITTVLDKYNSYRPPFDYADGFHTFSVLWTPDTVTHYVDGVPVAKRRMKWRHSDGSEAGPAHVLVNLAVGGSWPGPPQTQEQISPPPWQSSTSAFGKKQASERMRLTRSEFT